jgi:hypothetical protein
VDSGYYVDSGNTGIPDVVIINCSVGMDGREGSDGRRGSGSSFGSDGSITSDRSVGSIGTLLLGRE